MGIKATGYMSALSFCGTCKLIAHNFVPQELDGVDRQIHNLPSFRGKTCWQIAHEQLAISQQGGQGIWSWKKGGKYAVRTSHPICVELRRHHKVGDATGKKRNNKRSRADGDDGED